MKTLEERRRIKLETKFNYVCVDCKKPAKDFIDEQSSLIVDANGEQYLATNDGKALLCNLCFVKQIKEMNHLKSRLLR
jgi:hypothetical protein